MDAPHIGDVDTSGHCFFRLVDKSNRSQYPKLGIRIMI